MEFVVVGVYVIVVGVCGVYACDRVCWLMLPNVGFGLGHEHALCIMLPNVLNVGFGFVLPKLSLC